MTPIRSCFIAPMALTLGALVAQPAAAAGRNIDQTRSVAAGTTVAIENVAGTVTVHGSGDKRVHVGGELATEAQQVRIQTGDDTLRIMVIYPDRSAIRAGADLEVSLPQSSPLVVGTVSGSVTTDGRLAGEHLQTVSGELDLAARADEISAQSVSGDIDVSLDNESTQRLALASTSGEVNYDGGLAADGTYRLDAVSGDIDLNVPAEAGAHYDLATLSGDIDHDIGPGPARDGASPTLSLSFTQGDGGAQVTARSVSGDIALSSD